VRNNAAIIKELDIEGYRSIQKLVLKFGQINVITGANGCGKSNVYKTIYLLAQAAKGELAQTLALEGGVPSLMWAGAKRRANFNKTEVRLNLRAICTDVSYELSCGTPIPVPYSMFLLDPEVKQEAVWLGDKKRPSTLLLERDNSTAFIFDKEQNKHTYPFFLSNSESVLAQLHEPHLYPEVAALSKQLQNWRFYHNFRTDQNSLLRQPQIGVRTTVLSNTGYDLAAALRTIMEVGNENKLNEAIEIAFPGSKLSIIDPYGKSRFEIQLQMKGILRPLTASELSDGTLRYLCMVAALLSPRLPLVMVLNEPEMSLHPDLIPPLAELIIYAAASSQVIITTHSQQLVKILQQNPLSNTINLTMTENGTQIKNDYS
jgi:predicted ATPase